VFKYPFYPFPYNFIYQVAPENWYVAKTYGSLLLALTAIIIIPYPSCPADKGITAL
jgi:hypothetical protein